MYKRQVTYPADGICYTALGPQGRSEEQTLSEREEGGGSWAEDFERRISSVEEQLILFHGALADSREQHDRQHGELLRMMDDCVLLDLVIYTRLNSLILARLRNLKMGQFCDSA